MTDAEQREAARQFVNRWMGKGKEDEDGRSYWIDLLTNVLGMDNVTERLNFEKKVVIDGNTKRIDVYIPETRVIIEQKSLGKALDQKIRNSGDVDLTPFEQADRYNGKLTFDERARWIVTSNFAEIWIYDMNQKQPEPTKIALDELQSKYPLLDFLVKKEVKTISHEMEVSIKAGDIVGLIYDAFLKQYRIPDIKEKDETSEQKEKREHKLKSLNALCVRIVFCLYAEDAGILGKVYWDREIETGRIKRAIIDIFFDSYFQLFIQDKQYNISNEDKLMYSRVDRLAQSYQHFINKYCGGNKNIVLDQMKEYAECFRNNLNPNQCGMSIPKEEGIERINVVIFGLKNTTMIPYILYIAKNVQDKNELNKMYGILESYIMRRVVVHASTKSYNNLFTSLILNKVLDSQTLTLRLKGIGDATTYCPDDNEMKIGFETSKLVNLQSKGIIYLLESKIRSDNSSTALLGFNNYSLEHLMPKKWRNNWGACATEDDAKKRDSLLLTLGNLAIIPQALNASIRDAAWNVKKAGKGQNKPGLLLCASGLYTLHDVLQKNDWNEHEIENRAEWLLANAQNIWKI